MRATKTVQKKQNSADAVTTGRILRPVVLELIFTFLISNLNSLIINRFSADAVAATTAVGTFLSLMLNLYSVFYAGAGILLAPYWGSGRYAEGSSVWSVSLFDNFVLSLVLGGIGFAGHAGICSLLKVPMELQKMAGGYLTIALGLSVFQGFTLTFSTAFRSIGSMHVAMMGNTLISGSCVLLNFLVFKWIPTQQQTIYHYALAGIAAQMLGCAFYFWMARRDTRITLRLFGPDWRQTCLQTTGKMFRLGFFGGMEGVIYLLAQTVLVSMIGRLGTDALKISGYCANVTNYLTIPANAFTITTATLVGLAIGAGDEQKLKRCVKQGLRLALGATTALELAALLFGKSVLRLYVSDDAMLRACMQLILVDAFVELSRCVAAILISGLKAIGDVRTPFVMVIVGGGLSIAAAWLFGIRLGLGLPGVWVGYGVDLSLRGIVGMVRWRQHVTRRSYPILGQTN